MKIRYEVGIAASLALLGSLSGCSWLQDLFSLQEVTPVPANIYAISVEAFNICTPNNRYCDPQRAVGPPDETSPWKGRFVSLGGKGGYIIALMSAEFTNGPGEDLRVYEVGKRQGGIDEPFDVFISQDGAVWIQVADNIKNDAGKVYASIDIAPYADAYKYVKVVDESTHTSGTPPGSDIDAIEALWAARTAAVYVAFIWPVLGISVSDPLQNTRDPRQDGWYVANGFGNACPDCSGDPTHPYHPGEDWNRLGGRDQDANLPVYAIADGEVIRSTKLSDELGWAVIIRHRLPQEIDITPYVLPGTLPPRPRTSVVSSAYFHLNRPRFGELDIRKGDSPVPIRRGEVVGTIFPNTPGGPHLHFEIRANDDVRTADPATSVNGYYASPQAITDFGYIDPSAFLRAQIASIQQ